MSAEILKVRAFVSDSLFPYRSSVPLDARVYVLWNGVSGFPYYVSIYDLTPRTTSFVQVLKMKDRFSDPYRWCNSLGPPRFDGDIWSCNWSIEKFTEEVKSYDYLFVGGVDQVFITHYGSMFAPGSLESGAQMFRVTQRENGIYFEPLPRQV